MTNEEIEKIARVTHSVNKAYCESIGDHTQPFWEEAPEWQKESAIEGVKFHLKGSHTPEESHESWMKQKREDGWVLGIVKDPIKKEHPCMVAYEYLPQAQKTKDYLFSAVVESMKSKFDFSQMESISIHEGDDIVFTSKGVAIASGKSISMEDYK